VVSEKVLTFGLGVSWSDHASYFSTAPLQSSLLPYNSQRTLCKLSDDGRFEVFTAVTVKYAVFWDVTP
jgi:hypothetical protein